MRCAHEQPLVDGSIAIDGTSVYWASTGAIMRTAK
jgi:hypothetical protein